MKKVLAVIIFSSLFFTTGCSVFSGMLDWQVLYNKYIDGYWGDWNTFYFQSDKVGFYGDYGDFIIYRCSNHRSDYILKIVAENCNLSYKNKKENKKAIKNGISYEYKGYITYRYNGEKISSGAQIVRDFDDCSLGGRQVITRPAIIRVFPKRDGYCYNIYFDGVGIGLCIPWQVAVEY